MQYTAWFNKGVSCNSPITAWCATNPDKIYSGQFPGKIKPDLTNDSKTVYIIHVVDVQLIRPSMYYNVIIIFKLDHDNTRFV